MKKVYKRIISLVLVVTMLVCSSLPAFAADVAEEYICDLRLIYADDYDEAKEALVGTDFEDYKIFNANLNDDTDEIGVWLAYKTTTDIDDAITDVSVMQMNGGYKEGNYKQMIEESLAEYEEMGENYVTAIDYFIEAYDEGHFLAELAYRQLNFYTSITDESLGIEIPDFDGELLGDIFYDGITASELATIFMEGNSYALANIRSLLAMGVSYNEDGKHYLEKVAEAAALFKEGGEDAFEDHDYYDDFDDLALVISGTIKIWREMFEELAAYEDEMNFYDEEVTELEVKYIEHKSFADRFREVEYLNGKTLYDFCMNFEYNEDDLTPLYPLAYALNEGQIAMVKVAHYGDVVRYSMTDFPEEELIAEVERLEKIYKENPFNVYTGVDRSIFYGTFALTSAAYRQDAYTEEGLFNHMFMEKTAWTVSAIASAAGSVLFAAWAINRTVAALDAHTTVASVKAVVNAMGHTIDNIRFVVDNSMVAISTKTLGIQAYGATCGEAINNLLVKILPTYTNSWVYTQGTFSDKLTVLCNHFESATTAEMSQISAADIEAVNKLQSQYADMTEGMSDFINHEKSGYEVVAADAATSKLALFGTGVLYVVSAALMLYSAYTLGHTVWSYYHPKYEDIPTALVDLIETVDGDRYIKYDVVYNAETNDDGVYEAADLNAFEGQRWNALYYTKSYEAGKPLLADTFVVSTSNNTPKEGYTPVHRFGELVCYNLNKYTYGFTPSIYLSVKQSKNDKSAATDVPQIIGSMFGSGFLALAGGVGVIVGVGGVLATQEILKKKKSAADKADPMPEQTKDA